MNGQTVQSNNIEAEFLLQMSANASIQSILLVVLTGDVPCNSLFPLR